MAVNTSAAGLLRNVLLSIARLVSVHVSSNRCSSLMESWIFHASLLKHNNKSKLLTLVASEGTSWMALCCAAPSSDRLTCFTVLMNEITIVVILEPRASALSQTLLGSATFVRASAINRHQIKIVHSPKQKKESNLSEQPSFAESLSPPAANWPQM